MNFADFFDLKNIESLRLPLCELRMHLTALGLGVILGFLVKKYLRFLIVGTLVSLLVLKGLEIREFIKVDWLAINDMVGIKPTTTMEEWSEMLYIVATENIYYSAVAFFGFFIGYKAG